MFACTIDMSYLLWARSIDIRTLKESQIEDGWIRIKPSKTQKTSGKAVDIMAAFAQSRRRTTCIGYSYAA
ncbi:hypothetical protein ACWYXK_05055 [Janthinobacterium lividum]